MSTFTSWFKRGSAPRGPSSTGGARVYAIGDVHGRNDLLLDLLDKIEADRQVRDPEHQSIVVFLGDYVDRGLQSREVIDTILRFTATTPMEVRPLKGNHEHQMLLFLEDASAGPAWGAYGGRETLISYGVRPPAVNGPAELWEDARLALADALPAEHLEFLKSLTLSTICGDYLFVHAGVRPGVAIEDNAEIDLLTIRDEFLNCRIPFEKVVVHGHTPQQEPQMGEIRIGVDTGAYATGRLTAVRLWGEDRLVIQAVG